MGARVGSRVRGGASASLMHIGIFAISQLASPRRSAVAAPRTRRTRNTPRSVPTVIPGTHAHCSPRLTVLRLSPGPDVGRCGEQCDGGWSPEVPCPCAPQPMLSGSMTTRCVVIVRACREIQLPGLAAMVITGVLVRGEPPASSPAKKNHETCVTRGVTTHPRSLFSSSQVYTV